MINFLVCVVVVLVAYVAFMHGRRYERKQFVRIGKPKRLTVQDVIFKKEK